MLFPPQRLPTILRLHRLIPASPGNTSPNPSDDLSKYLLASLAISPFHDDSYMKVMQAYDAANNESPISHTIAPIPPPSIFASISSVNHINMLIPKFLSSERVVYHLKKRAHSDHPPLTSALPQIETILNHLDELPLEQIKNIEDIIEGLDSGFYREHNKDDVEIVRARVRVSTLERITKDIPVATINNEESSRQDSEAPKNHNDDH
ncbi:hypothetical protein Tco_1515594 [Tanacetum coccineum]